MTDKPTPAVAQAIRKAIEECAVAVRGHDFGPSTMCPDCHNTTHSEHVYAMALTDAEKRIRALAGDSCFSCGLSRSDCKCSSMTDKPTPSAESVATVRELLPCRERCAVMSQPTDPPDNHLADCPAGFVVVIALLLDRELAKARVEERERCAVTADRYRHDWKLHGATVSNVVNHVTAAIRELK